MHVQVSDLEEFLETAGLGASAGRPVDIVGFSFGGRVALAFAAAHPKSVRRLVATSAGGTRGSYGRLVLAQWRALLQGNSNHDEVGDGPCSPASKKARELEPFAWASLLATHHPRFLAKHELRVAGWCSLVASANTRKGLYALVTQTHDDDDENGAAAVAAACRAGGVAGKVIFGAEDMMLDVGSIPRFAQAAGFEWSCFDMCAHAVPIEEASKWRREVLGFLDGGSETG